MKKCKKCGYENPNSLNVCEKCYNILDNEISKETSEKFFKKLELKEKIIKIINYALLIIYFMVVAPLFYISVKAMGSLGAGLVLFFLLLVIIPVMYYTSLFHPDTLFELTYFNVISNIHDAQPSDWYYTTTSLTAYLFLGLGIFMTVKIFLEVIWKYSF